VPKACQNLSNKNWEIIEDIANDPDFKNKMKVTGLEVKYLGQEEFVKKWSCEANRLAKIVQETRIADKIAAQKK
jgi:phage pi2 protein 07